MALKKSADSKTPASFRGRQKEDTAEGIKLEALQESCAGLTEYFKYFIIE